MKNNATLLRHVMYSCLALLAAAALVSCEETELTNTEYDDWCNRNNTYFAERMAEARTAVAQAKAAYGDDWEAHCDWRMYRSAAKATDPAAPAAITDSICCKVIERGTGTGYPYSTDSVRVNYVGRLMPSASYVNGFVFDHSGLYSSDEYVFNPNLSTPARILVSSTVDGFATAVQHMRIGDRWKVYIPWQLGYGATAKNSIPAYSTLVFDLQLKGFARAGNATK